MIRTFLLDEMRELGTPLPWSAFGFLVRLELVLSVARRRCSVGSSDVRHWQAGYEGALVEVKGDIGRNNTIYVWRLFPIRSST